MMSYSFIGETMQRKQSLLNTTRRFAASESGVALVEFALLLPIMMVVFTVMVEGARLFWAYQTTVSGIHDAARFLARAAPSNLCATHPSVSGYAPELMTMVTQNTSGTALIPTGITVNSVTPSYICVSGAYRASPIAIAQVSANITVTFPFGGIFALVGSSLPTVTTIVTDHSRVYGA